MIVANVSTRVTIALRSIRLPWRFNLLTYISVRDLYLGYGWGRISWDWVRDISLVMDISKVLALHEAL